MNAVLNYIQHKLGEPAELRALLKKYSGFAATLEQPPQSIAGSSVVKWHEWGQPYSGHRFGAGTDCLLAFCLSLQTSPFRVAPLPLIPLPLIP